MGAIMEVLLLALSMRMRDVPIIIFLRVLAIVRIVVLFSMSVLHFYARRREIVQKTTFSEREGLLSDDQAEYGTNSNKPSEKPIAPKLQGGWLDYFIGFRILFPYLW